MADSTRGGTNFGGSIPEMPNFRGAGREYPANGARDRDCASADVEHHFDTHGKRGRADALRTSDRRNPQRRDSSDQPTEVGAKAFSTDAIGERERECPLQ